MEQHCIGVDCPLNRHASSSPRKQMPTSNPEQQSERSAGFGECPPVSLAKPLGSQLILARWREAEMRARHDHPQKPEDHQKNINLRCPFLRICPPRQASNIPSRLPNLRMPGRATSVRVGSAAFHDDKYGGSSGRRRRRRCLVSSQCVRQTSAASRIIRPLKGWSGAATPGNLIDPLLKAQSHGLSVLKFPSECCTDMPLKKTLNHGFILLDSIFVASPA